MKKISPHELFGQLWEFYAAQNPQVLSIHNLLAQRESLDCLVNDHIALRTFSDPRIALDKLGRNFSLLGFEERAAYELRDKHVFAKYYAHPSGQWPKVFISELQMQHLSRSAQEKITELIDQISKKTLQSQALCATGRLWEISYKEYLELLKESDYAAWVAAHGFQMNHATLSVNAMSSFSNLEALIDFLEKHGFFMHTQGDEKIQKAFDPHGKFLLKQASTVAAKVSTFFSDGEHNIPGCYYEFIERFQGYEGFDPGNASKIMESTHAKDSLH